MSGGGEGHGENIYVYRILRTRRRWGDGKTGGKREGKEEQGNGVSRRKDTVKELRSRCRALWRRADEHEVERPVAYVCTADRLAAVLRGRASGVLGTDFD